MSDAKHTPGPWRIHRGPNNTREIMANAIPYISVLSSGNKQRDANAHLIAAAPELLKALTLIRRYAGARDNEGLAGYAEGCRLADAAIAKATGGE